MSQRTNKVSSVIQQVVASELAQLPNSAYLTVTKVAVSPDLRAATILVGVLADSKAAQGAFQAAEEARDQLQAAVAKRLTTKFVPKLTIQRDLGGEYAEHITKVIRGL